MDYSEIGLKAGLEIHQQIETSSKLFCNCPTDADGGEPDIKVERKLRASAGEGGSVDVAAAYEHARGKKYVYEACSGSVCAVELDEEPIHGLNRDAVYVCLQVASMLRARPVDRILVMRKTVVDGSNTSGFQRTALVARNGAIESLSGKVRISTVCIEEESARVVKRGAGHDVYDLSRLGIPLVEIATEADITGPEHLREVAEHIGMLLRSTGKVKRGIGTIRQDVNVSIREGSRVEIKGAQDLRLLGKLVENEALRQKNLAGIAAELKARKAAPSGSADVTEILKGANSKLVAGALKSGLRIKALGLKGFKGIVGREIQPGRRLGTELSGHAKARAGVKGIIHSDELPGYGITEENVEGVRKKLGCGEEDAFAFVAAEGEKADAALKAVAERALEAVQGVPSEVRKAVKDGTTEYLRPMPGSERMYPETDAVPMAPPGEVETPRLLSETADSYEKLGLGRDLAHSIAKGGASGFFEMMVEESGSVRPAFIAEVIVSYPKEMERRNLDHSGIGGDHLKAVFRALGEGRIAKESVMDILAEVAQGQSLDLERHATMSDGDLRKELKTVVAENEGLPFNALIGKAMAKLRGRAPGEKIAGMLKELSG